MADEDRASGNAAKAFATLQALLTEMDWDPKPTDEGVLLVDFTAEPIPVRDAVAIVRFDIERFVIYFNLRDVVTNARRAEVAEFITRANVGLLVGNFELNLDDGSVRFKSSIDFTQVELSKRLIRNAILSAMDTVEHYAEAIAEVADGKKSAKKAYQETEAGL